MHWTIAEETKARQLLNNHCPGREFLKLCGRTKEAAQMHFHYLKIKDDPVRRIAYNRRKQSRRHLKNEKLESVGGAEVYVVNRPTEEMLEAARRRLMAPRSNTALICGDPAPGQSALDQKRNAHWPWYM